jgi:hypothetical protein
VWWTQVVEAGKWGIKALTRRPGNRLPSYRDLRSRGFFARLDCSAAKRDLGWTPEGDSLRLLAEIERMAAAQNGERS